MYSSDGAWQDFITADNISSIYSFHSVVMCKIWEHLRNAVVLFRLAVLLSTVQVTHAMVFANSDIAYFCYAVSYHILHAANVSVKCRSCTAYLIE